MCCSTCRKYTHFFLRDSLATSTDLGCPSPGAHCWCPVRLLEDNVQLRINDSGKRCNTRTEVLVRTSFASPKHTLKKIKNKAVDLVQALHVTCHAACHYFRSVTKLNVCQCRTYVSSHHERYLPTVIERLVLPGLYPSISQCKLPLTVNVWPHVHWHREHDHAPCGRVLEGRHPTHLEHT